MAKSNTSPEAIADGTFDWTDGVDSNRLTTVQSQLNPNGLKRSQLAWLNNATVRGGGIIQRFGWQPLTKLLASGRYQGGFLYEPDSGEPYLVFSVSGVIYSITLSPPYVLTNLTRGLAALHNPSSPEMCFFTQGENYLIIQAGDYDTPGVPLPGKTDSLGRTLPLFWNGTTLRRSIGITTLTPAAAPGQNEIPAATCMDYYANRIWYAQDRQYSAGDIVGSRNSGTVANHYRDSILNITENPLCFGGDGFTVPTNAGNIRAIKHSANLNASLGQGQLYIFTRKTVYTQTVPVTRTDWINADANNQPKQDVVQLVNGSVNDRTVVPVNGDLYCQSLEPGIRSQIMATRYFQQWSNTPISQAEQRALQFNDRALMRFGCGMQFNNRMWQTALPTRALDGLNVIHKAILPLDFDIVTSFGENKTPVWEGAYDGIQFLQLFSGDFGGRERGFATMISDADGSINIWEMTSDSRTENGDSRVVWSAEFPAFTWSVHGVEFLLKQLIGGECWIDKVFGTVDMSWYFRPDADPCWRFWFNTQFCAARNCWEDDPACVITAYPPPPYREGYRWPIVFPDPGSVKGCDSMAVRPVTWGYQFQTKVVVKGWCRIRGLVLYAIPREKAQYQGVVEAPIPGSMPLTTNGMNKLPNPFVP